MFKEYVKGGRVIHATEFAYETLYKSQGYVPRQIYCNFDAKPLLGFAISDAELPTSDEAVSQLITGKFALDGNILSGVVPIGQGSGETADNGAGDTAKSKRKRNKS